MYLTSSNYLVLGQDRGGLIVILFLIFIEVHGFNSLKGYVLQKALFIMNLWCMNMNYDEVNFLVFLAVILKKAIEF